MLNRFSAALIVGLASALGVAQSFNIDLDVEFGPPEGGNGAPSSAFGAAAAQPGHWNRVNAGLHDIPVTLRDLNGSLGAAQLTATGGVGSYGGSGWMGNTGDYRALLNDYARIGGINPQIDYHFTGLSAGRYLVYTYAVNASGETVATNVTIAGAVIPTQTVTGPMPGDQLVLGVTHSVHELTLTGDSFVIQMTGTWPFSVVNGFQIAAVPEPATLAPLLAAAAFLVRRNSSC